MRPYKRCSEWQWQIGLLLISSLSYRRVSQGGGDLRGISGRRLGLSSLIDLFCSKSYSTVAIAGSGLPVPLSIDLLSFGIAIDMSSLSRYQ